MQTASLPFHRQQFAITLNSPAPVGALIDTPPAPPANAFQRAAAEMEEAQQEGLVGGSELRLDAALIAYLDSHPNRLTGVEIDCILTGAPEKRQSASSKRIRKSTGQEEPTIYFVAPYSVQTSDGGNIAGKVLSPVEPAKIRTLSVNAPAKLSCRWNEKRVIRGNPSPGYDVSLVL